MFLEYLLIFPLFMREKKAFLFILYVQQLIILEFQILNYSLSLSTILFFQGTIDLRLDIEIWSIYGYGQTSVVSL